MKTFTLGVDIGATTIKAGAMNRYGKLIDQYAVETYADKGPPIVIRQIVLAIKEIFGRHKISECAGIGIGAPGIVVVESQVVKHPPNFSNWKQIALGKEIRSEFKLPVFIENDANCAALAESRLGNAKDFKNFLFVIWGTGVGGGIIIDNKIFRGPYGGAGEIGHISIDYNGPDCNCGGRGCIESYIGQRYLSKRTVDYLKKMASMSRQSKIHELVSGRLNKIEPIHITKAAEGGDMLAIDILKEAGELLGCAIASALNILDLNVVVIGGGVSAVPDFVYDALTESLLSRVLTHRRPDIRVVRASLGNTAGMLGAACLVI